MVISWTCTYVHGQYLCPHTVVSSGQKLQRRSPSCHLITNNGVTDPCSRSSRKQNFPGGPKSAVATGCCAEIERLPFILKKPLGERPPPPPPTHPKKKKEKKKRKKKKKEKKKKKMLASSIRPTGQLKNHQYLFINPGK